MSFIRLAALSSVMLCMPLLAQAEVRIELFIEHQTVEYSFIDPDGILASHGLNANGNSAYALADLSDGILRATATSSPVDTTGVHKGSNSTIGDSFIFKGPTNGTAYLDYSFSGTISNFGDYSYAGMSIYIANPTIGGSSVFGLALTNTEGMCNNLLFAIYSLGCHTGTSISTQGTIPIAIEPGEIYILNSLSASAANGGIVDFSGTANFFLRLPEGVTIESRTGAFLATAVPIAVPETSALLLMMAGAFVLLAKRFFAPRLALSGRFNLAEKSCLLSQGNVNGFLPLASSRREGFGDAPASRRKSVLVVE